MIVSGFDVLIICVWVVALFSLGHYFRNREDYQ
jgi:hypothetical protein